MNEWVCFALLNYQQEKIILVQDKNKPRPGLWKMPGGKKQSWEEYYAQTITRELTEELPYSGATITTAEPVKKQSKNKPNPHAFIVFEGKCYFPPKPGGEVKKVKEFTKEEIISLIKSNKVVSSHSDVLKEILIKNY